MLPEPTLDRRDYVGLLLGRQRSAPLDVMPSSKAPAAACRRRVLCDEHWMSTKGRLFTVIAGGGRRESLRHEVRGVGQDGGQALGVEIIALPRTELKALAKRRALQGDENGVQFFHST